MTPLDFAEDDLSFIGELCVALAHRWEPERLFVIFTAYCDESDTHGSAPNVIIAAFLASARQWELFGRRLRDLQRRYGFKILHTKDFRARHGEFKGWSDDKCRKLVEELANAVRDNLAEGVTALLPRALYESEYRAPPVPKGMPLDSQYGLCFRACLYRLIQILTEKQKERHRLHIVIEDGHKNVGDTIRVFKEVQAEMLAIGIDILRTITVAKKADNDLLMVADFQAHLASISEAHLKVGKPGYFELARDDSLIHRDAVKANEAALTQFEFTAQTCRDFKVNWQKDKDERIRKWRDAREAKRASSPTSSEQPA